MCTINEDHMKYGSWGKRCNTQSFFCHFGPFFALLPHYWPQKLKFEKTTQSAKRHYPFTHVCHKWRSYDLWSWRYKAWQTKFFFILGLFCPLTLLKTQKINILPGEILSLSSATQTFFVILGFFLPFYPSPPSPIPLTTPENQIFEKMKNTPPKIISYDENEKENHMMHGSWDMEHDRQNFFSFWMIFWPFTP